MHVYYTYANFRLNSKTNVQCTSIIVTVHYMIGEVNTAKICLFLFKQLFVFIGEAIEKMLQEKKISSKINYEVLKSLNVTVNTSSKELQKSGELTHTKQEMDNASSSSKT